VQVGDLPVRGDLDDLGVREAFDDLPAAVGVAGLRLGVDRADLAQPGGGRGGGRQRHNRFNDSSNPMIPARVPLRRPFERAVAVGNPAHKSLRSARGRIARSGST
jgi:hypothetical protein